jgi:phosphoribosylanthranilate isomerase
MWRVKICGNRTHADVAAATSGGADAVGLIVGVRHLSEDALSPDRARALLMTIRPSVTSVLVTHMTSAWEVLAIHGNLPTAAIQLHDDIPVAEVQLIRLALPRVALIKAVHVTSPEALTQARAIGQQVDALLLDSCASDRIGGTGKVHDWAISAEIVRSLGTKVILAGGLTPENVEPAIETVRPYGVDVNSGVDNANGDKDPLKVELFVRRARQALCATGAQVSELRVYDLALSAAM